MVRDSSFGESRVLTKYHVCGNLCFVSSPTGEESNPSNAVSSMRVAVPKGSGLLLVLTEIIHPSGDTSEDRLRNIGKEILGIALTPAFGWYGEGCVNYIVDPIDPVGGNMSGLSRFLYEQRWIPKAPESDEESYFIYDPAMPAVQVLPLTKTSLTN